MVLVRFPQWRVAERGQQKRGQDLKVDVAMYTEVERCHGNCDYEGVVYHAMAPGDRRGRSRERDRLAWIDYLGQVCRPTGWRVSGRVLTGQSPLSDRDSRGQSSQRDAMAADGVYCVFNRRRNLSGRKNWQEPAGLSLEQPDRRVSLPSAETTGMGEC
jgi:hypothetical protein